MKTLKTLALCAVFAPVATIAQAAATEEQLATVRAAIESAGCVITTDDAAAQVESATGYEEETLRAVVDELRVMGEVGDASEEGGIRLLTGGCAE
ncbi:hypothetical protein Ga0609869_002842 [Rhodovulum iodosum]|uniref:Uncharacterized protein n=1 Tax=Rhodovulum iodosum TaxID=68291 RepID=A0ABV3XWG6_9RHOB|nr:hypothetical protein [Rhodovulum robiginosum]RSK36416.1 hypothetical protein EJA01_05055 [Rhodovulum robiginosum]